MVEQQSFGFPHCFLLLLLSLLPLLSLLLSIFLSVICHVQAGKTRLDQRAIYLWGWQGLHIPGQKLLSTSQCLFVLHCPWSLEGGICHPYLWIWEYWLWFQSGKSPVQSYSIPQTPERGEKVHADRYVVHTKLLCYLTHIYWFTDVCRNTDAYVCLLLAQLLVLPAFARQDVAS